MPAYIKHGLIVHHLPWCDQHCQDHPTFASIHDVMRVVAQVGSSPFEAHGCGIRVGDADPKISGSPVEAMDFSLLPAFFRDPVVSSSIVCRKVLKLSLVDGSGEKHGTRAGGLHR